MLRRLSRPKKSRETAQRSAGSGVADGIAGIVATEQGLKSGRPSNCTLETVEIEAPKLLKGEGILDAIEDGIFKGIDYIAHEN
jgi:hypothetical protein